MEVITLTLSCVAIIASGFAAFYTWRQAVATEDQAEEAKRANNRLDEIDRAEKEAGRIRWAITTTGDRSFVLRNMGRETAYDVRITSSAAMFTTGPLTGGKENAMFQSEVRAGMGISFMAVFSPIVGSGREAMVSWRGQDEPVAVPIP